MKGRRNTEFIAERKLNIKERFFIILKNMNVSHFFKLQNTGKYKEIKFT